MKIEKEIPMSIIVWGLVVAVVLLVVNVFALALVDKNKDEDKLND